MVQVSRVWTIGPPLGPEKIFISFYRAYIYRRKVQWSKEKKRESYKKKKEYIREERDLEIPFNVCSPRFFLDRWTNDS